jgi:HEAT repeat protein
MRRLLLGRSRYALIAALLAAIALPGCCCHQHRFGGPWPFGADETADLAKYGPVAVQRVAEIQAQAKKAAKGTAEQQEAFTADLAKRMQQETNCTVRLAIISTLTKFNTASANAVLYAGLKDPEADVRVACCEAWGLRPGPDATRILSETLSTDTDHDVRMAAVRALASAGDKQAVKALGIALEDPDPSMQYVAVASLKSVTGQNLGTDVNAWREMAKRDDPPVRGKTSVAQRLRDLF